MKADNSSPVTSSWRQTTLSSVSLLASLGTLVCCALPALLVTLGMGMALAGLVSAMPWVVVLSEHKVLVFGVSGGVLCLAALLQWRGRRAPCPADPHKAKICTLLREVSWTLLGVAVVLYAVGFFFAFLAADIFF